MAPEQLANTLKEAQGYTVETKTCQTCETHEEVEMGIHKCQLNPVHHFRVNPSAHCNHWSVKRKS